MNSALATIPTVDQMTVVKGLAKYFVDSGLFKDTGDVAKAMVKIMLGQTLGIGPVESMMGVNIIQGRIALSANLMAAKVKASGKYNYRVTTSTNEVCEIEFYEAGESVGKASFTITEAKAAGLSDKAVWRQYPSDMLFARALSRGARRYCPDAFGAAAVYTPEELGAEVDPESGQVVKQPAAQITPPATPDFTDGDFTDDVPTIDVTPEPTAVKGTAKTRLETMNELGAAKFGDDWPAMRDEMVSKRTGGKATDAGKLMPSALDDMIKELQLPTAA